MLLFHYYDKKTGPFKNLSDLSDEEANRILLDIKNEKPETMCAKRQDSYIADRRRFEEILRNEFKKRVEKLSAKSLIIWWLENARGYRAGSKIAII